MRKKARTASSGRANLLFRPTKDDFTLGVESQTARFLRDNRKRPQTERLYSSKECQNRRDGQRW